MHALCLGVHPIKNRGQKRPPGMVSSSIADDFEKWLDSHDVERSALSISEFDGIRGVRAERDIHPEEIVLSVPLSACITDAGDPLHGIPSKVWRQQLPWQTRLALTLCMHRTMGESSPYHAYLAALPQSPPRVPMRWTDEELAELQDMFLLTEIDGLDFWRHALYDDILMHLEEEQAQGNAQNTASMPLPPREEFQWALDLMQSRSIRADELSDVEDNMKAPEQHTGRDDGSTQANMHSIRALVPFLDMLNHSPHASTEFRLEKSGKKVEVFYACVNTCMFVCVCVCIFMYAYLSIYVSKYTHTLIYLHTCAYPLHTENRHA